MNAIAIKHNDQIIDLQTAEELGFEGEQIHLDNSEDSLEVLRHSTAHLMAQAIKSLYPDAKFIFRSDEIAIRGITNSFNDFFIFLISFICI